MDISAWLDDQFFECGCFFPLKDEESIILAKGGEWRTEPTTKEIIFQVRDFYNQEKKYYHPDQVIIIPLKELQKSLPENQFNFKLEGEKKFENLFKLDFKAFRESLPHLKKAVLMSRLEYQVDSPLSLKKHAFYRSIFSTIGEPYGFWENDYALIGSTPEILFEFEGDLIKSFALAGTAPLEQGENLLHSKKNLQEHNLVIKNIMEDLGPFCSEIKSFETKTAPFGSLVHLKTLIEGRLRNGFKSDELIKAMSPTAALGGYPRIRAKDFLLKTQYFKTFPKRFHGSVFSLRFRNKERSLVMIRNVQIQNKTLILEAGAGIVEASSEKNELAEIYQKLDATREILL